LFTFDSKTGTVQLTDKATNTTLEKNNDTTNNELFVYWTDEENNKHKIGTVKTRKEKNGAYSFDYSPQAAYAQGDFAGDVYAAMLNAGGKQSRAAYNYNKARTGRSNDGQEGEFWNTFFDYYHDDIMKILASDEEREKFLKAETVEKKMNMLNYKDFMKLYARA